MGSPDTGAREPQPGVLELARRLADATDNAERNAALGDLYNALAAGVGVPPDARRLIRLGNKLADAAERLERNPMANCLPRFRLPVEDAVAEWREAVAGVGVPPDETQLVADLRNALERVWLKEEKVYRTEFLRLMGRDDPFDKLTGVGVPPDEERLNAVRLSALASVASVIAALGDDVPSLLVDAHRVLATGYTDDQRPSAGVGEARPAAPPQPDEGDAWDLVAIREHVVRWMSNPALLDNVIPASPDSVLWLVDENQRLRGQLDAARETLSRIEQDARADGNTWVANLARAALGDVAAPLPSVDDHPGYDGDK